MNIAAASDARVDLTLGVLGPTVVLHDGRAVTVGGPAPRTLLCRLVIANGRFVSIDALVDCLWPHDPPPSARITAQGYLSVLRRALEPGRLPRQPGRVLIRDGAGYALRLGLITLDAERFGAAVTQGRDLLAGGDARSALVRFDEALALWRGPAYADCADHEFVVAESQRLQELRTGAVEHRLAALIELGAHETAAAGLRAFLVEHPLRERGWALLAQALYRAGRQGDALAALRDARHRLMDELGVEPGPELAELHHDILDQALTPVPSPFMDRAGTRSSSNLPHSISTLVGRVGERQVVSDLLSRHRLVTLTGAGGMGKTRLALAVAGARRDADGPWFVELAGLHEPAVLAGRLCAALQITGTGGIDTLIAALRSRAMLIVLDNCEHVAGAVGALVSALLSACPNVRVLTTSRQSLRVDGEHLFEVPPLSSGVEGEAVTLFIERAAAVLSGWSPGADERRLIAHLCAALDGMPLAIEFAAAQCRVLSPRQILEHLDDRFALLSGERTSSRHTTLLGLMDSWYELLNDAEREALQALAVFEGGFALSAAKAVTGRSDTLIDLTSLVEKSLVTVVNGDDRRYVMLETIRQYALRRTPVDRRDALGGRHTAWIRELADIAGDELRGPDSATWMRLLHIESDNVRAAMRRASAAGDTAAVLRIAGGLYWFWYRQGRVDDGLHYLEPALRQADPRIHEHALVARAAMGLALLRYVGGARGQVAEALALAGRHGAATDDLGVRAQVLATIAYFEAADGAAQAAVRHAAEALALARSVGHHATAAEALMCLGEAQRRSGLAVQAEATLAAALREADRCGHGWATVSVLWLMSKIELSLDRPGKATVLVRRMLEEAHRRADTTGWLVSVAMYAHLMARAGRAEDAVELLGTVRSLGDRVGYQAEAMDAELAGYLAEIPSGSPPDRFAAAEARGRDRSVEQTMAWLRSDPPFGDQRFSSRVTVPDVRAERTPPRAVGRR
ncbi:BTAD domain-containing putative transcriptional regulator [Dactylosporangium sp. NPDC051484]|uniref:BTAD domain-containing putative transcriptional regulator n=1 Tax=Dactylosporangium sp. NPDC051484 TaxID=3154942 RepID=UPI00344D0697